MSKKNQLKRRKDVERAGRKRVQAMAENQAATAQAMVNLKALQTKIHGMAMVMVGAVMLLNKKGFVTIDGVLTPVFIEDDAVHGPEGVLEVLPEDVAKIISNAELTEIISKVAQDHGTVQPKEVQPTASGVETESDAEPGDTSDAGSSDAEPELLDYSDPGASTGDAVRDGLGCNDEDNCEPRGPSPHDHGDEDPSAARVPIMTKHAGPLPGPGRAPDPFDPEGHDAGDEHPVDDSLLLGKEFPTEPTDPGPSLDDLGLGDQDVVF